MEFTSGSYQVQIFETEFAGSTDKLSLSSTAYTASRALPRYTATVTECIAACMCSAYLFSPKNICNTLRRTEKFAFVYY